MIDKKLEKRLVEIEANNALALGRLNGIASLVIVMGRNLPSDIAAKCAVYTRELIRHVEADLVASNKPDVMVNEIQRIIQEGISVFEAAAGMKNADKS